MVRFGDIQLDVAGRELLRDGRAVHLEPQAFDLLVLLIEHRDRLVSKIELLDGVWGHRFVSEANLTTRIKEIRRAVGDDGSRQHIIRSVRGRGYRFVADIEGSAGVIPSERVRATAAVIGRSVEIEALMAALVHSPLVTLTGSGGVGKSTLARTIAERMARSFSDGAHVVELSALVAGEQVLPAVARSLDVVLDHERPERAFGSIAERNALLVLDNCEHVIDDVSSLIDELMGVGGVRITVLATSQIRLGLSVEQVVALRPLDTAPAVELFTIRAKGVRRDWDLDEVGRERVETLVAGLDRLPLTIEMAAARLGSMTFGELEQAMVGGLPMPMTHRSPMRRHRSLTSLVTWSAGLLDSPLRQTFTDFSVFAGSVTAADAAAVLRTASSSMNFDLAALAERSLVVADVAGSVTRYRMLATVRAVARSWLLESSTAEEIRRQHARYFADVVESIDLEIRTPQEADGRRRLDAIVEEVRVAHRWARDNQPDLASRMSGALHLAAYSTFWNEPVEWSRSLLAQNPDAGSDELVGARIVVAGADANRGELLAARVAASVLSNAGDQRARAAGIEILADVAIYDGHLDQVPGLTDELRRLGTELGDSHFVAIAAVDEALALSFDNESGRAVLLLDGLDLRGLSPSDRAWVRYARGEALSAAGDRQATEAFSEATEMASDIGNPFVTSVARVALATERARSGQFREALGSFAVCLHEYSRHGNFVHAVTTLRNLVGLLVAVDDDRGAVLLASATSGDHLRTSYGFEAVRLSAVVAGVEQRVGSRQFAEWSEEGQRLDLPQAVQVAAELVDRLRS